jgi:F-type H+-transporting ATPase subunit a
MNNTLFKDTLSPLDQFEINDLLTLDSPLLGYIHISLTTIGFYLILGTIFTLVLTLLATNYNKLISNN